LAAQAVAARSYALATLHPRQTFDVFADTRDQVYGGIRAETDSTNRAVGATAGEILMYGGRVALAYYSSTSRGPTAAGSKPSLAPAPPLSDWPPGKHGWTVVLQAVPQSAGESAATSLRAKAERAGLPRVGILVSDGYSTLRPGYRVVFSGVYGSAGSAQAAAR